MRNQLAIPGAIRALGAVGALFLFLTGSGCAESESADLSRLRILYSSDLLGELEPCG
ncbi:MAG: hypothetical protein HKN20_03125 [Gemmatimonadetes bacterium]|nr:hypothetical protein [Gemmatimonadota bacterium]